MSALRHIAELLQPRLRFAMERRGSLAGDDDGISDQLPAAVTGPCPDTLRHYLFVFLAAMAAVKMR